MPLAEVRWTRESTDSVILFRVRRLSLTGPARGPAAAEQAMSPDSAGRSCGLGLAPLCQVQGPVRPLRRAERQQR